MIERDLLARLLVEYPFQPATAIWRAAEVMHLSRQSFPDGRGLDLGCGDGRLTRILLERIGKRPLVGLDLDPFETELARSECIYDEVHTAPAADVPEPDASFDFVLSNSVMEHITEIEPVLREIARVLKTGGKVLITVPGIGFHRCLRGPLFPGVSRVRYLQSIDCRLAHKRYWRTEEWRIALGSAGLDLMQTSTYLTLPEVRRWEVVSRFTAGAAARLFHGRRPIEIQRSLGMRRPNLRMPTFQARIFASMLSALLLEGKYDPSEEEAGCILIVAGRK